MSVPFHSTCPAPGRSSPVITLTSVDLPEPDGPAIASCPPAATLSRGMLSAGVSRPGNPTSTPVRASDSIPDQTLAKRAPRRRSWLTKPVSGAVQDPRSSVPRASMRWFGSVKVCLRSR